MYTLYIFILLCNLGEGGLIMSSLEAYEWFLLCFFFIGFVCGSMLTLDSILVVVICVCMFFIIFNQLWLVHSIFENLSCLSLLLFFP